MLAEQQSKAVRAEGLGLGNHAERRQLLGLAGSTTCSREVASRLTVSKPPRWLGTRRLPVGNSLVEMTVEIGSVRHQHRDESRRAARECPSDMMHGHADTVSAAPS